MSKKILLHINEEDIRSVCRGTIDSILTRFNYTYKTKIDTVSLKLTTGAGAEVLDALKDISNLLRNIAKDLDNLDDLVNEMPDHKLDED